ncbi:MAG TPA: hypothetical protein VEG38_02910 [Acidimicrobiia bacterium]|nr:hypothetical protein [Acidimicrobiia bacterium]
MKFLWGTSPSPRPRRLAVYGLTAGLLGGGAAGMVMTGTTLASAQTSDVTGTVDDPAASTGSTTDDSSTTSNTEAGSASPATTEPPATTPDSSGSSGSNSESSPSTTAPEAEGPATPAPATPAPSGTAAKPSRGDWAKSALEPLVANGTITQAQADAVLAALDAARPAKGPGGRGGRHGFKNLDAAAQALGMTVEDLRAALEGGKSLAAIAGEKGIAVSAVVDALVGELKAHLDEHVASGKNTQAEADQLLANARARIEAFVNGTAPAGGPGFGFGRGGRHGRGPRPDAAAPSSSSSNSSGATVS